MMTCTQTRNDISTSCQKIRCSSEVEGEELALSEKGDVCTEYASSFKCAVGEQPS